MSSNAESSKTLAAIGALLLFLSFFPGIGIIGIILLLIGMKGLSEYYHDEGIYRNALRGVIFGIVGIIAVSAFSILGFFGGLFSAGFFGPAAVIGGILAVIVILIIAFAFYLMMAINLRRAFDELAVRSGENTFRTTGTLLFWGAVLTIIFIGLIIVWIAWLILAIAFFSMRLIPTQPYGQQPYPPPPAPPAVQATRFCPNCGSPVDATAVFCPHCGKQLPPP